MIIVTGFNYVLQYIYDNKKDVPVNKSNHQ